MGKKTLVINFDCIITDDKKVVFLESGPGLMRVGYHIDEQIKNRNTTREKIILDLLSFYGHVYIVYPKGFNIYEGMGITKGFLQSNNDKITLYTLEEIIKNKNQLKSDGVIIANTEAIPLGQSFHYANILRAQGITLPVANDSMPFRAFYEKAQMAYIFSQNSPDAIPNQVVVDYDNLSQSEKTINSFKSDYIILKPIDGTRAQGIVIVPKDRVKEILTWLADKSFLKMMKLPHFEDKEITARLQQLDNKADESTIRMCIAQEYVHPAEIVVNDAVFRPTTRIVIVACFDSDTKELTIKVTEAFYKLPTTPISNPKQLLWEENISYHELNRQVDMGTFFGKHPSKHQSQDNQNHNSQYPYIVLIPEELQEIIKQDILQSLTPVCHYLFTTEMPDYYANVLRSNDGLMQLMRQALKLTIHKELDEKLCDLFVKENVNIPIIFLYYLHNLIKIFRHTNKSGLLPAGFTHILLKYKACFGNQDTREMESIILIANKILLDDFLPKIFNAKDLKTIQNLLSDYRDGKFNQLSAEVNYLNGLEKAKAKNYKEAAEFFEKAIKNYPTGSKEQAICYFSLSSCYMRQGLFNKSIVAAEQAVQLRSALIQTKSIPEDDLDKAKDKLINAKALDKANQQANEALKFLTNGKNIDAVNSFEAAIKIHAKILDKSEMLAVYHYNLATAYERMDMLRHAKEHRIICHEMRLDLFGAEDKRTLKAQEMLDKLETKLEQYQTPTLS